MATIDINPILGTLLQTEEMRIAMQTEPDTRRFLIVHVFSGDLGDIMYSAPFFNYVRNVFGKRAKHIVVGEMADKGQRALLNMDDFTKLMHGTIFADPPISAELKGQSPVAYFMHSPVVQNDRTTTDSNAGTLLSLLSKASAMEIASQPLVSFIEYQLKKPANSAVNHLIVIDYSCFRFTIKQEFLRCNPVTQAPRLKQRSLIEWQFAHHRIEYSHMFRAVRDDIMCKDIPRDAARRSGFRRPSVVIARSMRYRQQGAENDLYQNALSCLATIGFKDFFFVGTDEEYDDFVSRVSYPSTGTRIIHAKCNDVTPVIHTVCNAEIFIGNQSFPFSAAQMYGVPSVLEVFPDAPDAICRYEQEPNSSYVGYYPGRVVPFLKYAGFAETGSDLVLRCLQISQEPLKLD